MPPITRRLRVFAAVLGLAQGAVPALALAHELAARDYVGSAAHAEPLGATHESSAHSHECGMCRNLVSKAGIPPRRSTLVLGAAGSQARPFDYGSVGPLRDD